jgi:uncharacterized membrane protein YfcA
MPLEPTQLALLVVAALSAGFVDAIAGGGGLLTLPAMLATGLPPHLALGTNKGQAVFGAASSLVAFARAGRIDRRRAPWVFPAGFAGSLAGAALVWLVDPAQLKPLILVLLVAAAIAVTVLRPARVAIDAGARPERRAVAIAISVAVGVYDGFFGPGTGTFLIVLFAWLLKDPLVEASANAKVVNFGTNLAAVALFAAKGAILWPLAVAMGLAQLTGAQIGARVTLRGGHGVVRGVTLAVMAALLVKVGWDVVHG